MHRRLGRQAGASCWAGKGGEKRLAFQQVTVASVASVGLEVLRDLEHAEELIALEVLERQDVATDQGCACNVHPPALRPVRRLNPRHTEIEHCLTKRPTRSLHRCSVAAVHLPGGRVGADVDGSGHLDCRRHVHIPACRNGSGAASVGLAHPANDVKPEVTRAEVAARIRPPRDRRSSRAAR